MENNNGICDSRKKFKRGRCLRGLISYPFLPHTVKQSILYKINTGIIQKSDAYLITSTQSDWDSFCQMSRLLLGNDSRKVTNSQKWQMCSGLPTFYLNYLGTNTLLYSWLWEDTIQTVPLASCTNLCQYNMAILTVWFNA